MNDVTSFLTTWLVLTLFAGISGLYLHHGRYGWAAYFALLAIAWPLVILAEAVSA